MGWGNLLHSLTINQCILASLKTLAMEVSYSVDLENNIGIWVGALLIHSRFKTRDKRVWAKIMKDGVTGTWPQKSSEVGRTGFYQCLLEIFMTGP